MKKIFTYFYILFSLLILYYLAIPNPKYPDPPPGSFVSSEPGDTEDPLRRAFFTNLSREEVVSYYKDAYKIKFLGFDLPTLRLNHPPEDANNVIKELTRSTFLEEIVYPMRTSFYINGFKPKDKKDAIIVDDKEWVQKITVKNVESNSILRTFLGGFVLFLGWVVFEKWLSLFGIWKRK